MSKPGRGIEMGVAVKMIDTLSNRGRQAPTWQQAIFAAILVFVVMFAVSACFLDWVSAMGLAFWFAVFTSVITMEGNRA